MSMNRMTPPEAWEGFVGNQTPEEFMEVSRQKGFPNVTEASIAYVNDSPDMFGNVDQVERFDIALLLCAYIRAQGIN